MATQDWQNLAAQIVASADAKVAAARRVMGQTRDDFMAKSIALCPQSPTNATTPGVRKKRIKNPFYTGHPKDLRNSAAAEPVEQTSTELRTAYKFTAAHAFVVHERPQPAHGAALKAKHPDVQFNSINDAGKWKFIDRVVIPNRAKAVERIAEAVNRA